MICQLYRHHQNLKNLPDSFELGIKVDAHFINTFISGKGALSEAETFTILTDNDKTRNRDWICKYRI